MKEVVKVSISGVAFTFENDAYSIMKVYLSRLEAGYAKNPDGREIVADIEARIAELILNEQESEKIVSTGLVQSVVDQLGFPDDIEDAQEESASSKLPKRLYRNPEGRIFGGVCSGLGTYFNADPVWVRLIFFMPLLLVIVTAIPFRYHHVDIISFFGTMIPVFFMLYFVMWIAIPLARTPRQRLEMRGERITASSIRQTFTEETDTAPGNDKRHRSASVLADLVYVLGRIVLVFIKAVVCFVAMILGIVGIAFVAVALDAVFGGNLSDGWIFLNAFRDMQGITPEIYLLLLSIASFIPIFIVVYFLIKTLFNAKSNKTFMLIMLIVWVLLVMYLSIMTARNRDNLKFGANKLMHQTEYVQDFVLDNIWEDDSVIEEYYDDIFDDDWDDESDFDGIFRQNNTIFDVKRGGDSVVISRKIIAPDTKDTLSNEVVTIYKGNRKVKRQIISRNSNTLVETISNN